MTVGQIMVESLRLMFAGSDEMLVPENIGQIEDDVQFRDYCQMMPGSITRCLYDMERRRVIPDVTRVLSERDMDAAQQGLPLGEEWVPAPSGEIRFFVREGRGTRFADIWNVGELIRKARRAGSAVSAVYMPRVTPVTADTERYTEVCVPDRMACLIPYFVKSECLRMDPTTAGEAGYAWNVYESAVMEESDKKMSPVQRLVQDETGFTEWSEFA